MRIGIVKVTSSTTPSGRKNWLLEYRHQGERVRKRIFQDQATLDDVREIALHLSRQALEKKSFAPPEEASTPTIGEGITQAVQLASTSEVVTKERTRLGVKFVQWLGENHSEITSWELMRPSILQEYTNVLEREGRAFDTVRLAIAPIKLAWTQMHQDFPDQVRPCPKIKLKAKPREEMETLRPVEVDAVLTWLKAHQPDLWPIAVLQALCGLRIYEATALRRQDVNLDEGVITVCDTEHHQTKTDSSRRKIPVCKEAVTALKTAMKGKKLIRVDEIFTNQSGNLWTKDAMVLRWTRLRPKLAKDTGLTELKHMQSRRLRSFFVTTASQLGVSDRLIKAYVGHAAGDVLGQHYLRIDVEELKTVSTAMDGWRELITKGNDKASPNGNHNANGTISKTDEHGAEPVQNAKIQG